MVLWFLPAEEFSQAQTPLFYKVICPSAAFVHSEANNGCLQLRLMNRTSRQVLWICQHTLSVVRIANVVMPMVSKWWTAEIQLATAAARRRSRSPFHLILLSSYCLPCAGSVVKMSPWADLNHLAEENKSCKKHQLSFCCLRAESACKKI